MLILVTATVTADAGEDGRVMLTFPSGRDTIELSLSAHQAMRLSRTAANAAIDIMAPEPPQSAQVVPFDPRGGAKPNL